MCNEHTEFRDYEKAQIDMFAAAKERGLPPALLAKKAKLPSSTVAGWATGTAMPVWAFSILCRFIPDDITSAMFEPSEKQLVPIETDEQLLDELCCEAAELSVEHSRSRHPASPGGVAIVHTEKGPMKRRARRIAALAAAVAK